MYYNPAIHQVLELVIITSGSRWKSLGSYCFRHTFSSVWLQPLKSLLYCFYQSKEQSSYLVFTFLEPGPFRWPSVYTTLWPWPGVTLWPSKNLLGTCFTKIRHRLIFFLFMLLTRLFTSGSPKLKGVCRVAQRMEHLDFQSRGLLV